MKSENQQQIIEAYNVCLINEAQAIECRCQNNLGRPERWKIDLHDPEYFTISDRKGERHYAKADIQELIFEIESYGHVENFVHIANAYVVFKGQEHPQELFSMPVKEGHKLSSKSEAYRLTSTILSRLSERYAIPNSYKYSVYTIKKTKKLWWAIGFILILFLAMILTIFLK